MHIVMQSYGNITESDKMNPTKNKESDMNTSPTNDHVDADTIYDAMTSALPSNTMTPELLDALTHLSASAIYNLFVVISAGEATQTDAVPTDVDFSVEHLIDMFSVQLKKAVTVLLEQNQNNGE